MNKQEKQQEVESISKRISENPHFYLADISGLNAEVTHQLRKACHKQGIKLSVVKNTLLQRALEEAEGDYSEMYDTLKGNTSMLFSQVGNAPAKLIKDFSKKYEKPVLKAASVEESIYVGAEHLAALVDIKSKDELIGELIGLLQSPAKNVISSLQSPGRGLSGILKTLAEKGE